MEAPEKIRNIGSLNRIKYGKTTLTDELLQQLIADRENRVNSEECRDAQCSEDRVGKIF